MSKLYDAAVEVQTFCQQQDWRACVIGGLPLLRRTPAAGLNFVRALMSTATSL